MLGLRPRMTGIEWRYPISAQGKDIAKAWVLGERFLSQRGELIEIGAVGSDAPDQRLGPTAD